MTKSKWHEFPKEKPDGKDDWYIVTGVARWCEKTKVYPCEWDGEIFKIYDCPENIIIDAIAWMKVPKYVNNNST